MKKIIKFEKAGCVPCQRVQNLLDENDIDAEKVNPFDDPDKAIKFGVMNVPVTILLDENGEEIKRSLGFNEGELEELIAKFNS